ncbi:MAG: hypothetical protein XE04_1962 [Marinimicrobia bacterium 46_43]|nr:MAG: hypothetical protein XE04_1962 [Marinimicrobia bacterium 46_43]
MIVRISRYTLILVAVVVMAIYLPDFYWLLFDVKTPSPYVSYSPVDSVFIMYRREGNDLVFRDEAGNTYTRDEYEAKLPFFYYMQLISDGRMPESLHGIELDVNEIKKNRNMHRLRSLMLDVPQIPLYPLLESESGRVNLEFPDEYFRITDEGMEFINSISRKVDKEMSALFTQALEEKGFEFPAKMIFTNPTTRKAFDEGCFVVDSKDHLYHIKKTKGQPVVVNTHFPGKATLRITTDLFFRQVTLDKEDGIDVFVTDRDYNLIDEYHESWKTREEYPQGKVARAIFPFSASLNDGSSAYVGLYTDWHFPLAWIGNIIALLIFVFFLKKEDRKLKKSIPELLLVAVTGLYGLIACMVYIYVPLWRSERK